MTDFSRVETEFERLKAQFESGALTEAEFKSQLEELMIEDEQGQWWIIGYESGLWYYHDGDQWVQSDPPPVVQRREQAEAEAEAKAKVDVEVAPAPVLVEEAEEQVEVAPTPVPVEEPEPEVEVEAAPEPVRAEKPEVVPVAEERPMIRPAVPEEAEAVPTQPKSRTVWIVATVIVVVVVAIVLYQILRPPEPEFGIWAERDFIQPGQCTLLLWAAPGLEGVRVVGPGTDDTMLMPPEGNLEVCPEATSWYELKGPEWEELSRVQVQVGE